MEEAFNKEKIDKWVSRLETAAGRRGPSYTTILHSARKELQLTTNEYVLADTVHTLSSSRSRISGWCYASKKYLGESLDVSERTVFTLINKTKEKGVIESHADHPNLLRTTEKWFNTVEVIREKRRRDAA